MSILKKKVEADQHQHSKTRESSSGKSMEDLDTTEKLLSHPENKKRLLEAINSPTKGHLVFDNMKDLKDALRA